MAVVLTWQGSSPGQPQYGLATLTEHYKVQNDDGSQITAAAAMLAGPQIGDAHPGYPFMFVTDRYCAETGESASALDVTYMGVLGGSHAITLNDPGVDYAPGDHLGLASGGEIATLVVNSVGGGGEILTFSVLYNNFTVSHTALTASNLEGGAGSGATFDVDATAFELPPQKASTGGQVASATTNTSSAIFPLTATNPATVQFYAISNALTFISTDPGDSSEPDDPPEITDLITWDLGFGLQPGLSMPDLVDFLLTQAFVQGIIEAPADVEPIVAGQFYQITKRKTRTLFPYAPPS